MLNTKLYKQVHTLAERLLTASEQESASEFERLYKELEKICVENEGGEKNHPVQWETLGDFTEDSDEALVIYLKALSFAEKAEAHDYIASINYAMAYMLYQCGENAQALAAAQKANEQVGNIGDETLKQEISDLLDELQ